MLAAAYECVGAKCDNSTMAGNYYEAGFLIQVRFPPHLWTGLIRL